jgi:hypothetical protein
MKYEWKKQDKKLYLPKNKPELIEIPSMKFFMIQGRGNPNDEAFSEAIGVLYSLSYAVRMLSKSGETPEGYFEYTVFPLEGIWGQDEEGRKMKTLDKDRLIYTLMIRQPDFLTEELAKLVIEKTKKKKPHALLDKVEFGTLEEGTCVQMMHIGSYDNEPESFKIMEEFCQNKGLKRKEKIHREIYISDFRKTQPEKLKTVLRFKV